MTTAYSLPRISYSVAYHLLPHYAFQALEKPLALWQKTPHSAGAFYYLMACQMNELEPVPDDARHFAATSGVLGDHDYHLMAYPVPPPLGLSEEELASRLRQGHGPVLAPHFSVILHHRTTGGVLYYVLGQSPLGGGTTLRTITPDGINANLGPGPAPEPDLFLAQVAEAIAG